MNIVCCHVFEWRGECYPDNAVSVFYVVGRSCCLGPSTQSVVVRPGYLTHRFHSRAVTNAVRLTQTHTHTHTTVTEVLAGYRSHNGPPDNRCACNKSRYRPCFDLQTIQAVIPRQHTGFPFMCPVHCLGDFCIQVPRVVLRRPKAARVIPRRSFLGNLRSIS